MMNGKVLTNLANNNPKIDSLVKFNQDKTLKTIIKVDNAIKALTKEKENINFNSVSAMSGVSKSFLYTNQTIRERINFLRNQQKGLPSRKTFKSNITDKSKDVIIESLRRKVEKLEKEKLELAMQLNKELSDIYNKL